MRIIGVDPGLNITGFGLIEDNNEVLKIINAGFIKTSSRELMQKRLDKIYSGILKIILEYKPEILVLEKIFSHYKHPATAISLGYARGAVCLAAGRTGIPIKDFSAKRVKKAVTGSGSASKHQVQKMIQHLFNLKEPTRYYDTSDALALALSYKYLT